jgi:transcriptional regulator with GAF, ATPase, and Fis domain
MGKGKFFKILKQLQASHYLFLGFIVVGFYLLLFVPTLPMKLLGTGIVVLSFIGLVISLFRAGEVFGRTEYSELRKPSEDLPEDLHVETKETADAKVQIFETLSGVQAEQIEKAPKPKKEPKPRRDWLRKFLNFVSNADEVQMHPLEQKYISDSKYSTSDSEQNINIEEGGFKVIREREGSISKTDILKRTEPERLPKNKIELPEPEVPEKKEIDKVVPSEIIEAKETPPAEEQPIKPETTTTTTTAAFKVSVTATDVNVKATEELEPKPKEIVKERRIEVDFSELVEEEPRGKGEPIKEMKILFEKMLNVIRTVTKTQTAAFFLVNHTKQELVLQAIVSERKNELRQERKIPLNGDLVSQLVHRGKPEIVDFINPNAVVDLIPYYAKQVKVESFIGVPISYKNSIIGILCADTDVSDVYDRYTVNFFMHYSKLFVFLLESFTEKYELSLENKVLEQIEDFKKFLFAENFNIIEPLKNVVNMILNNFDFVTAGICFYDYDAKFYRVFEIRSKKNIDLNLRMKKVDLQRSLLGRALQQGKPISVEFDERKMRINFNETKIKKGYFTAVPIKAREGVYGAIFGIADEQYPIESQYIKMLDSLALVLGLMYENVIMQIKINAKIALKERDYRFDEQAFMHRLEEECLRSSDYGQIFSVCKISINNYLYSNYQSPQFEIEAKKILYEYLRRVLKTYDVVGEFQDQTIWVIMIGRSGKDAKSLMEMVREKIAQTQLKIEDDVVYFTISVGIAQFSKDIDVKQLCDNLNKAWEISQSRKNQVVLY